MLNEEELRAVARYLAALYNERAAQHAYAAAFKVGIAARDIA